MTRVSALRKAGCYFLLAYVWVDSADVSVARVSRRVMLGGHHLPEDTIRRRYSRGLIKFFDLYMPIADEWRFYDNSTAGNRILVAEGGVDCPQLIHGAETWQTILQMATRARTEI